MDSFRDGLGNLGGGIDVTQICVVAFFLFFIALVLHLRTEDKREGFPLVDPAGGPPPPDGFPPIPKPKVFLLMDGEVALTPHVEAPEPVSARPMRPWPGAPLVPTGDPLVDGVGPAAYPQRRDKPLLYGEGKVQVLPMRLLPEWRFAYDDLDPRDMPVFAERRLVGRVADVWIDRSVKILRYLEVELSLPESVGRRAWIPIHHAIVDRGRGEVRLKGVPPRALYTAPQLAASDVITAREEDRTAAYFAGARFFPKVPGAHP